MSDRLQQIFKRAHATKLQTLRIEECSGVDDPANMSPGWLFLKQRLTKRIAPPTAVGSYLRAVDPNDPSKGLAGVYFEKGDSPATMLTAMHLLGADEEVLKVFGAASGYTDEVAVETLQKYVQPAVPPGTDGIEAGAGSDDTTPLPGNRGDARQTTGGEHHSNRQTRTPGGRFSLWRHQGAVHRGLR